MLALATAGCERAIEDVIRGTRPAPGEVEAAQVEAESPGAVLERAAEATMPPTLGAAFASFDSVPDALDGLTQVPTSTELGEAVRFTDGALDVRVDFQDWRPELTALLPTDDWEITRGEDFQLRVRSGTTAFQILVFDDDVFVNVSVSGVGGREPEEVQAAFVEVAVAIFEAVPYR